MRPHPLLPGPGFILTFLCVGLLLICYELRLESSPAESCEGKGWVLLEDGEGGDIFLPIRTSQQLGERVKATLPRFQETFSESCRQIILEPGTRILVREQPGFEAPSCTVIPAPERMRYLLGMPININRATEEELEMLPGIGPTLAASIHRAREEKGDFVSPGDLLEVKGIGRRILERILRVAALQDPS